MYNSSRQKGGSASSSFTIGKDTATGELVTCDEDSRLRSMFILGKAGSGKTNLMEGMANQDIQNDDGVCVIDPHGDMVSHILPHIPSTRIKDVVLIDPLDTDYAPGINLYDSERNTEATTLAIDYVLQIFEGLFTQGNIMQDAPNLAKTLRNASYVLSDNFPTYGTTLAEIPLLVDSKEARAKLLANVGQKHSLVKRFFADLDAMQKPADRLQLTGSTISRLEPFLENEFIRHIIAQSRTTLNFRCLMDEQKIILVSLPRRFADISSLLGSLVISGIIAAAFSRVNIAESQRKPFYLYIDELSLFSSSALARMISTLFAESRKFKLAITAACQWLGQLDEETRHAVFNAGSLVAYTISGEDSEVFAKEYSVVLPSAPSETGIVSSDIIPHLLKEGHPSETVVTFIQEYLRTFQNARGEDIEIVRSSRQDGVKYYPIQTYRIQSLDGECEYRFNPDTISQGMVALNDFLYNCVRDKTTYIGSGDIPLSVTHPFAHLLGCSNYLRVVSTNPTPELKKARETLAKLYQERKETIWKPMKQAKTEAEINMWLDKEEAFNKEYRGTELMYESMGWFWFKDLLERQKRPLANIKWCESGFVYSGSLSTDEETMYVAMKLMRSEKITYESFCRDISMVVAALQQTPIFSSNSKYGLPPASSRTVADLRNELAQQLTQQGKYCAYAKIGMKEYTALQALPLPPPLSEGYNLKEKIRLQNFAAGYTQRRSDIESEIERRQKQLTPPESPPTVSELPSPKPPRPQFMPSIEAIDEEPPDLPPPTQFPPLHAHPSPPPPRQYTDAELAYIRKFSKVNGYAPSYIPFSETPDERKRRRFRQVNGYDMPEYGHAAPALQNGSSAYPVAPAPQTRQKKSLQKPSLRQLPQSSKQKQTKQEEDEEP